MGYRDVNDVIQTDGMSDALRNSLWNVLDIHIWSRRGFKTNSVGDLGDIYPFSRTLWVNYFKQRVDSIPNYAHLIMSVISKYFFNCQWYEIYDFIEFICQSYPNRPMVKDINIMLEKELSGFRLIDNYFVPVTDDAEKEAIEKALEPGPFESVRTHLRQALEHLANRENPDYRNSIKESISAVESLACELSNNQKATLGDALKVLKNEGKLHSALEKGFSAIYGYTSDADGIRHGMGMLEEKNIDEADAKYFLVSCSAFINYLISKHAKAK